VTVTVPAPPPSSRQSILDRYIAGLVDLSAGLGRWRLWSAFAWEDIRNSYRRSMFGALWVSLSFAAFVGVKIVIFGPMIGRVDADYFGAYLLVGFFAWQFMSQAVTAAPSVFISNEAWIKNDPLPYSVYVYQSVSRSLFNMALTGLTVIVFYIYFGQPLGANAWLMLPALALYILNAAWVTLFLGVLCTRFRDITHLTQTIMRFMFFLTPIFWIPAQMPAQLMEYLWWNPFAHFIWILRTPVLDNGPATESWIFVGAVTLIGWALAITTFSLFRRRIAFWF